MKVAVTGASGHIGNCLVRSLTEKGASVRALVHRSETGVPSHGVEVVRGDLLDSGALAHLCEGADTVFHLAAKVSIDNRQPAALFEVNVKGTGLVIEAAARSGVRKFVHFSSIDALHPGNGNLPLDEHSELVTARKNLYAYTKARSEELVVKAAAEGLDAVIVSPTAVIGPYDHKVSILGSALLKIYSQKLPFLVRGGYNWVDVRDVAHAAIHAIHAGKRGVKYIVAGHYCEVGQLYRMVGDISGKSVPVRYVPHGLARMAAPILSFYAGVTGRKPLYTSHSLELLVHSPKQIADNRARSDLDHRPRPLEETLRDTLLWFKENKYLS